MSVSTSAIPELNETNWMSWSSRMTARLCQLGLWHIIDESWEKPKLDLIVATKDVNGKVIALTAEQQLVNAKIKLDHGASCKRYLLAKEKAAGDIYTHLSPSQRALVCSYKEDPAAMWGKLLKIHSQQVPGMCFGAYKLNKAKLPKLFWGKALATAKKVLNMLLSAALLPDTTPYEIIERCKPDYAPLQVFGCRAFAHIGKDKHKSLDSHTVSAGALVTMDFGFRFRDHVLSHTVYKPGGVTETSYCCLSSYHNLQSILASQIRVPRLLLHRTLWT
jgi:hypothetical protein